MNEPKLRFKADDGSQFPDWEKKKLSDIFVERREMQCIDDEYKLLSFTIEQGVINPEDKKTNKRDFLMKDKASKKFLRTEYNDIIYNPANLKYGAINRNKLGKGLLSPIYAIFYTEQNAVFMESIVRNPDFIKRTLKYLEGTVIKLMTLKPRDFLRMKSYIPCLEEQQKIAEFLSTIDTVIAKQKEIVSVWEERKKGVMQKLFRQEVRFKADDGSEFPDWEEKKLGEVGDIVTGNTPSTKQNDYYGECYLWVTPTDITDSREVTSTAKMLTELGYTVARHIPANSILVTCIASIGKNAILRENGSCNQQINSITPYDEYSVEFVYYLICQNEKLLHENAGTGGMEILNKENFSKIKMYFPCLAEQQKIADCLSSLDEVIEKQKATLSAWEEMKKGLLQQMFV